jgi:DNA-binding MarR family transcriptional regulator
MVEATQTAATRDRSPAYPAIALKPALERLVEFDAHFKRSPARPEKVGEAWKINTPATASRVAAALRYFGFLEYREGPSGREITVTEEGRKYLKAQQEETRREVVKSAALRPKQIAKSWEDWGQDRPADAACLDQLIQKYGFSVGGAREFLKVYDATIAYAGLSASDKVPEVDTADGGEDGQTEEDVAKVNVDPGASGKTKGILPPKEQRVTVMEGERELTTGMLAKDANFRLIVSGKIGVKEIERLIKKLELDKEILADFDLAEPPEHIRSARSSDLPNLVRRAVGDADEEGR